MIVRVTRARSVAPKTESVNTVSIHFFARERESVICLVRKWLFYVICSLFYTRMAVEKMARERESVICLVRKWPREQSFFTLVWHAATCIKARGSFMHIYIYIYVYLSIYLVSSVHLKRYLCPHSLQPIRSRKRGSTYPVLRASTHLDDCGVRVHYE